MMDGSTRQMYDLVIENALVFDGSGKDPRRVSVGVSAGRIAAVEEDISSAQAGQVVDGRGQWLLPGLLDIHTHFDLEVELEPALEEAVRHGTTTAVVSNCSLGLAYGNQRKNSGPDAGQDPVVDCYARVENVPKHILRAIADKATWRTSADYLAHFDGLPLGPNIVPMIPHSMLRIEVMGLKDAVSREPTEAELKEMEALLEKGMAEGYAGFSTDALPFHYLANDPHRDRRIPAQYGSYAEMKRLTEIVRRYGRVWQATPPKDSPVNVIKNFLLTSGRLHGKTLKITAVAALDVAANRSLAKLGLILSHVFNSSLLKGHFRLQALAAPFKVWAEGPLTPLAEEIPELRVLNEPDLEDRAARQAIMDDPAWQARFKAMWRRGKSGFGIDRLKRVMKREDLALDRDLAQMVVWRCPVEDWTDDDFQSIMERALHWQKTGQGARSETEHEAFADMPNPLGDDADFMLHLLRTYDTDLYWWTVSANRDPAVVRKLVTHEKLFPGFNDSGAHLTNMAFYDTNLRGLKIVQEDGYAAVARHVKRLTSEPAAFFGLHDVGMIAPGMRADLCLIDPAALADYDGDNSVREIFREGFNHNQLVNRSDGVVTGVWIAGHKAWDGKDFAPELGKKRMGSALTAGDRVGASLKEAAE